MAPSGHSTSLNCRSCGAPLASAERERCEYCGAAINAPVAAAKVAARHVNVATRKAWRRSWIYLAVFLGISMILAWRGQRNVERAVNKAKQAATPARPGASGTTGAAASAQQDLQLDTLLAAVPQPGGKIFFLFSSSRSSDHALFLLDPATSAVRWTAAPWSAALGKQQVVLLGDKVLVADESRLVALRLNDGTMLWQASLVADFMPYSGGLLASGDRVAVLVRDGTTQAFEVDSGRTVWSRKQSPPPSRLDGAGSSLLEFQRDGKGRRASDAIAVVDLGTGKVRHTLRSRCSTHSIIPAEQPRSGAQLLLSPDGDELYLFYGTFRHCAERWNLKSGKMAWQLNHARNGEEPRSVGGKTDLLLGPEYLFYPGGDKAVYALRRSSGELRRIASKAEMYYAPLLVQGDLLVITAAASWDANECGSAKQCSLLGIDIAKEVVLWRHALPPGARPGTHTTAARVASRFDADGLNLAQVSNKDLILDRLDLESGVSKLHKQLTFSYEISRLGYAGDLFWLWARAYYAVEPQTGAVRFKLD